MKSERKFHEKWESFVKSEKFSRKIRKFQEKWESFMKSENFFKNWGTISTEIIELILVMDPVKDGFERII